MGNTFGPNGFSSGSSTRLQIEVSKIIIHKAHQPNVIVDFFDADGLSGKDLAEIDFFLAQADASAMCHHDGLSWKG